MQDAVIKDGKLFCSKCGSPLGKVKDCSLVTVDGENYIQFIRHCSNIKCDELSHYETIITLEDRKVFVFSQENIKKVKEENKKEKVSEE